MPSLTEQQQLALADVLSAGPKVRKLTRLFAEAGESLYLVGGSVRDALLAFQRHGRPLPTAAHI